MAKLTISLDVPEVDPTLVDPQEIAETILASYEEARAAAYGGPGWPEVTLEEAEWT
jgi:hypothetical protein